MEHVEPCTAFEGSKCIASGRLSEVAVEAKRVIANPNHGPIVFFEALSARIIEVDLRGSEADVRRRIEAAPSKPTTPDPAATVAHAHDPVRRGPGRPKLGVVGREVTLLPQQWQWLGQQPGGASVTLRKLVQRAQRASEDDMRLRQGKDALYRFISVLAGDAPEYEEATRGLFADDREKFEFHTRDWPQDVRAHALLLADRAFGPRN